MASIIFNGPSSHTFDATVGDVITASAEVANNGDRTGYARMLIEGSPSGRGDLTTIPANSTVMVLATANTQAFMENTGRKLTARLYEMTANNEAIRVLGEHTQAVAQFAAQKAVPKKPAPKPPDSATMYVELYREWMDQFPLDGAVLQAAIAGMTQEQAIEWMQNSLAGVETEIIVVTDNTGVGTEVIVTTDGSVEMFRDGESVMIAANLVEHFKGAGWSLDPEEVTEVIIKGKPVVTPIVTPIVTSPVLTTAFDSVNLTEIEKLEEGYFFVEDRPLQIDTVELTDAEKIEEGDFFVDALPTVVEVVPQYTGPIDFVTPEVETIAWDDIYFTPYTPPVEEYVFHMDVLDLGTMEGRITAFEADSPYTGITREDVLAGIFGDDDEEEEPVFEVAPYWDEPVFEVAPYYEEPVFEVAPFYEEPVQVDTFQDTHDYFESIGAFDPVYEEVVIYEEDDGYVWLDPTPTTYEVDYWYGEG